MESYHCKTTSIYILNHLISSINISILFTTHKNTYGLSFAFGSVSIKEYKVTIKLVTITVQ